MIKQASLKDLRRMCDYYGRSTRDCRECPLMGYDCDITITKDLDKMNDIVVKWCEEHPVQTIAEKFFKQYPNARKFDLPSGEYIPVICPKEITNDCEIYEECARGRNCEACRTKYWLQEVSE